MVADVSDLALMLFILLEINIALNLLQLKRYKELKEEVEHVKGNALLTYDEMVAIRERLERIKGEIRSQLVLR